MRSTPLVLEAVAVAPRSTATDGASIYRDAIDAFLRGDNNEALSLAERAAKLTGPHQLHAKVLYGDTLFRDGEYACAKTIYIALLTSVTTDARVAITKKIVLCNTKLKLPERDGVPAP